MSNLKEIERIESQIRDLNNHIEMLKMMDKPGMKQLRQVLKRFNLDEADIKVALQETAPSQKRVSKLAGKKLKPKYCNPADKSETWAGRGVRPQWVVDALRAGKTLADLEV